MAEQYRPRLHFLARDTRVSEPTVRSQTNLLPRSVVENHPDVAEAYDRFVNATQARTLAHRESRKARDKATQGRADYQAKVREAVSSGADTSKLKDPHDRYIAEAEAHDAVARNAEGQILRLGNELGVALHTAGANLFGPSEAQMEAAASRVRADLEALTESWAQYARGWQIRRILSDITFYGGSLANYDDNPKLPAEVEQALANIGDRLSDLDKLRSDEGELTEWRKREAKAAAYVPPPTQDWA